MERHLTQAVLQTIFCPHPHQGSLIKLAILQERNFFSLVINKLKKKAFFFYNSYEMQSPFFPPAFHSPGDIICAMFILKV